MKRGRWMLILAVFGGAFAIWLAARASQPPVTVRVESPAGIAPIRPSLAPGPTAVPASPPTPTIPAAVERQVLLPRPRPEVFDAGLKPVALRTPTDGPVDKRENPGPRARQEMEMVRYAFETMDEDIRSCLEQWESSEPGQAGEVMVAFEIDADGLQKSWLEHDAGIPFGPRSCLANAVYGIDWSHIVDHPAKLTNRFELRREDAGN